MRMGTLRVVVLAIALAAIAACAAGAEQWTEDHPAGFLQGVWHGLILVPAFVVSLFRHGVAIYEPDNVGHWYDLGFLIGAAVALGGGGHTASSRKRGGRGDHGRVGE